MYDWESELKTKEQNIWTKEKIAPQHLFTALIYRTLKAAIIVYNQLLFFFYEDDEIISWLPSVKQSTLKGMKRDISGILSSLTFK